MHLWEHRPVAVLRDDAKREEALGEMVARIGEADQAEFEETARMMIERHERLDCRRAEGENALAQPRVELLSGLTQPGRWGSGDMRVDLHGLDAGR
jgi:hypothetical protein